MICIDLVEGGKQLRDLNLDDLMFNLVYNKNISL